MTESSLTLLFDDKQAGKIRSMTNSTQHSHLMTESTLMLLFDD